MKLNIIYRNKNKKNNKRKNNAKKIGIKYYRYKKISYIK